ncbi:protein-glutamine gamma-glutamyltransferase [Alteribacillus sp. YIM 98480]|uniref:protein-glutamine gamma-glutamyltransferase n=1 Tax=Alteribacillus sp. YIM 98480 TaxID=2606599 RepID=UPI00131DB4E6|nr:protein-glutamine gamma-glutamyltransferase [Alteribacillus sp. YIM 98480]
MIQVAGMAFQQTNLWPSGSIENSIVKALMQDSLIYSFPSMNVLSFEVELRKNIILNARALHDSNVEFEIFSMTRANPQYWFVTNIGAIELLPGARPSDAIRDIFTNSSLYGFECATAMIIIYYHAVLHVIGENLFNRLFQNIQLYSWNFDPDLGLTTRNTNNFIPGDVVYFENPDYHPQMSQWRGENAVVLDDGMYFGHGIGITTASEMVEILNDLRKPNATQSAYLSSIVARPNFFHLANIAMQRPDFVRRKWMYMIIQHNENSISLDRYIFYLYSLPNPFI